MGIGRIRFDQISPSSKFDLCIPYGSVKITHLLYTSNLTGDVWVCGLCVPTSDIIQKEESTLEATWNADIHSQWNGCNKI